MIATPCYQGMVQAEYCDSLVWTCRELLRAGVRYKPVKFKNAPVNIARNRLVANFLASDYTHLLFVDYDIAWKPRDVFRLLAASLQHDIGVSVGVYPKRQAGLENRWPVNFRTWNGRPVVHPETGYIELQDATTGFMVLRRDALERMMAAYPERKCRLQEQPPPFPAEEPFEYDLFSFFIDADRQMLTEDFGFCRLWQGIGGRVWADPEIELVHDGYKGSIKSLLEMGTEDIERGQNGGVFDQAAHGASDL